MSDLVICFGHVEWVAWSPPSEVSPKHDLPLLQLNLVYHATVRENDVSAILADILAVHGVTEFGRLAGHYRLLFRELSSEVSPVSCSELWEFAVSVGMVFSCNTAAKWSAMTVLAYRVRQGRWQIASVFSNLMRLAGNEKN
ncbi:hypothetical protein [Bradyrhizobium pachyrhizi]|uniref:hypothetical protein n=1 Tax=Bradyrhizobium pachyrhizi TaxID=280333 RepID=UPI003D36A2B7